MTRLRFLSMPQSNFAGPILCVLGNLTKLQAHYLEGEYLLHVYNLEWTSNLVSLQYLNMSYVNMTNVANMKVLSSLPLLSHLGLSECELRNMNFVQLKSTFFTSLESLDLSYITHYNHKVSVL